MFPLLERAALFITHSGMNSVSEGLLAGVPLLMIPQTADQRSIARHVQRLGAGKMLHKTKLNTQRLRKVTEEVLAQPAFQQMSANIGASLSLSIPACIGSMGRVSYTDFNVIYIRLQMCTSMCALRFNGPEL